MPDDAILCAILAEVRGLRADLRRTATAAPLADRLVQAVRGLLEGAKFNQAQLLALANSRLSTRLALRSVVEDIVGDVDQPGAGRRLGRFLAANMQHQVEGLRLVSLSKGRDGRVYRIVVATETRAARNWLDDDPEA